MKLKIVTYIELEPTRELWRQTKILQRKITEFVRKLKIKNGIITRTAQASDST
jgi:hypothetical protein